MRISCAYRCPQFVSGLRKGFVLLAASAVAACSDPSGPGERIAEPFSLAIRQSVERAFEPGGTEIVILRSDGSTEATISCPSPCNQPLAWSRDGRKLSLTGRAPGRSVLFVVNRDGTGLREVASVDTFHAQINSRVAYEAFFPPFEEDWSPDGRLVYVRTWASGHAVEIVSDDGSNRDTVFTRTEPRRVSGPRWAVGGAAISFLKDTVLSIIDADGRNLRALSDTAIPLGNRYDPQVSYVWSPDGRMVAFSLRGRDLMVHDMAAGITRKIFSNAGLGRNVCWSPSSDRLAFAVQGGRVSGNQWNPDVIVTINPDGSGLQEVLPDLATAYAHHRSFGWSPDGTYLVYQTYDDVSTHSGRILARHLISGRDVKIGDMDFRKSFVIETPGCYSLP